MPLRNSAAVNASQSVQLSPIGSRARFFQRHTHEASTFPLSPQKGGSKIPLRNFANQSNSCVARSLCDSWATCTKHNKLHAGRRRGRKNAVFCPRWPSRLTFDLDLQTHLSEGPNTSSLWIWRKSVQQLNSRDISYTNKKTQTHGAKNRTFGNWMLAVVKLRF